MDLLEERGDAKVPAAGGIQKGEGELSLQEAATSFASQKS